MATIYSVSCSCSLVHNVPSTDAGRAIDCPCGQRVEIPTLRQLRMTAGEPTAAIELELDEKLKSGMLPEEEHCLSCEMPTSDTAFTDVQCEGISRKTGSKSMLAILLIFVGPIWALIYREQFEDGREYGKHVAFRLPLRLCNPCRKRTWRHQIVRHVKKVPLYQRLLGKYPDSSFSRLTTE